MGYLAAAGLLAAAFALFVLEVWLEGRRRRGHQGGHPNGRNPGPVASEPAPMHGSDPLEKWTPDETP